MFEGLDFLRNKQNETLVSPELLRKGEKKIDEALLRYEKEFNENN